MRRLRLSALLLTLLLAIATAFVAYTLNPQPLPPSDDNEATGGSFDASVSVDAGYDPTTGASDAGSPSGDADSATDGGGGGDAGDGGDGGDASDAADD
jgi:hypothetical protein